MKSAGSRFAPHRRRTAIASWPAAPESACAAPTAIGRARPDDAMRSKMPSAGRQRAWKRPALCQATASSAHQLGETSAGVQGPWRAHGPCQDAWIVIPSSAWLQQCAYRHRLLADGGVPRNRVRRPVPRYRDRDPFLQLPDQRHLRVRGQHLPDSPALALPGWRAAHTGGLAQHELDGSCRWPSVAALRDDPGARESCAWRLSSGWVRRDVRERRRRVPGDHEGARLAHRYFVRNATMAIPRHRGCSAS